MKSGKKIGFFKTGEFVELLAGRAYGALYYYALLGRPGISIWCHKKKNILIDKSNSSTFYYEFFKIKAGKVTVVDLAYANMCQRPQGVYKKRSTGL